MDGAPKILKRVTWRDHAPFQGQFVVCRLGLATINLYTKYEVSMLAHYEDMKDDEKCKIGVVFLGGG